MTRFALTATLVVLALAAGAGPGLAQTPPEVVADVRVHGNYVTPTDHVVALSGLSVGEPFLPTTLDDVRRRLEASGRFEGVQVVKRYASIDDPSRVLVVIILDEGPVRIERPESDEDPLRVVRRGGLKNLMFLPVLHGEDGYGLTYGARVAWVDVTGERGRVSLPLTWGGTKQAGAIFDRTFAAGPLSRIEAGAAILERTNPAFDEDDTRRRVWGRVERYAGPVRAGAGAGWQRVSFGALRDDLRTVGADVAFDTRLTPVLPRNAVFATASWERVAFESGRPPVHRLRLDARGYLGLVGQSILEARAFREDASGPLPPYLKSLLGGSSSLRGFEPGAFAGDTVVGGSLELKLPLSSVLSAGKVGVSVFVDTGVAFDADERFDADRLRTGIGGSVWAMLTAFQLSLSVAHGRGADTRVHVAGGIVF